jgi:hypothetical protein
MLDEAQLSTVASRGNKTLFFGGSEHVGDVLAPWGEKVLATAVEQAWRLVHKLSPALQEVGEADQVSSTGASPLFEAALTSIE